MPWCGLCKKFLHMGLYKMVVEMTLAFPLFKKMHFRRRGHTSNKFISGATGLAADQWHDLFCFHNKHPVPFRHKENPSINKYQESSSPYGNAVIAFFHSFNPYDFYRSPSD